MHKLRYLFMVFVMFAYGAKAQQTRFRVTHYDETTGLQTNIINTILQDKTGYMWFGTANGLYRYDGYAFRLFKKNKNERNNLQNNNVLSLAEDRDGNIWMGLADGISSYNPATGLFSNYDVSTVDSASSLHAVRMLFIDEENNVWAGLQQQGLIKLNKASRHFLHYNIINDTTYSKEFRGVYNNVYDMAEEGNGMYWLATHDGLYRFNERTKQVRAERTTIKANNSIRTDLFKTIAKDKQGLWLGAYVGGVSYYNVKKKTWANYKYNGSRENVATTNIVNTIGFTKEGELWLASNDKGIGAFDTSVKRFDFCSDNEATKGLLPSRFCTFFYRDKQSNLWLSFPDGLYKVHYFDNRFQYIPLRVSKSTNNAFYGTTVILDDGKTNVLLIGTSFADGLHVFDKASGSAVTLPIDMMPKEENSMVINDIMKDHAGTVWVASRDYIYQYSQHTKKLIKIVQPPGYTKDRPSNSYSAIKEDSKGTIWISTFRNGVFSYNVNTKTYQHFYNQPHNKNSLPVNVITCLAIDKHDNIWTGSARGGFGYINAAGNYIAVNPPDKSAQHIYSLLTDKNGNVWAGSDDNLYCYQVTNKPQLKRTFTEENGLQGNEISSIKEDFQGNIWCTTTNAVCEILNEKVVSYGKLDGIDNAYSIGGVFSLHDKKLALTTYGGYYVFNTSVTQLTSATVPLAITSCKVDDKEQFYQSAGKRKPQIIVPATANVISFEYAALDFSRPDKQQYQYQLKGIDKDWVNAAGRRYVSYSNLPGGNYTFQVRKVEDNNAESAIISLPIHIVRPFYKTGWFMASVASLIVFSTYSFYRSRLKRQQRFHTLESKTQLLEKEKALAMYEGLKQQLNPHFLFNSLTSLNTLIHYEPKKAGQFLEGLSKIYRYILKSRDAETVTVTEEITFVRTFIQLQQTRFQGLQVSINIADDALHSRIVPVTLQNMIENAIKHNIIDEESPLQIDIFTKGEYIIVRNNLQKKNFVETSNKQGLVNLISLYRYLSEKPVVVEETGEQFIITIPLL